jgi:hypothetical protein
MPNAQVNDLLSLPACQAMSINGGSFENIGRDAINYNYTYHLTPTGPGQPTQRMPQDGPRSALWGLSIASLVISLVSIIVLSIYMQAFVSSLDGNLCSCR